MPGVTGSSPVSSTIFPTRGCNTPRVLLFRPALALHVDNHDLLDEARKDAFLLLIALDGFDLWGSTFTSRMRFRWERSGALASVLSNKLATIGRQTAGEPER